MIATSTPRSTHLLLRSERPSRGPLEARPKSPGFIRGEVQLCREWVKTLGLRPSLAIGQKVKGKRTNKPFEGEITRIDKAKGVYVICIESEGHIKGQSGELHPFEEVQCAVCGKPGYVLNNSFLCHPLKPARGETSETP